MTDERSTQLAARDDRRAVVIPFAPEYGRAVVELIVSIQREEFGLGITAADQPDLNDIAGFYQTSLGNFWIAVQAQAVVGTIALLDIGCGQAALRKMFVRRECRGAGQGTAKRLLETLLQWARASGIHEIYLGTTARFLAAHRFYEKHGFTEVSQAELPRAFPLMSVDTKFYRYVL